MGLYYTLTTTGWMFSSTIGLLLPAISADLDLSAGQQGVLGSATFWGALVLGIPMTWWFSRYRVLKVTTMSFALSTLFFFIQGWAPVFSVLLAGRLLFGVTRLAAQAARGILVRQWFSERESVLATTFDNALFGLIFGVGFLATPFLFKGLGDDWRMTLNIFGAISAALTFLWLLLGRERVTAEYRSRDVPREAGVLRGGLMYRDLWIVGMGFMGPTMATAAFIAFYPTLALEVHDVSLKWSGGVLAVTHTVGGAAGVGVGYLVFVTGKRNHLLAALGLVMAGTYIGMTWTGSLPLVLILAFINGISWGHWPALAAVVFQLPDIRPREVAVASTFTLTCGSAGLALGPLIAGFLQEALGDFRLTLSIVSLPALLLTAAGLLLTPPPTEVLGAVSRGKRAHSG